MFWCPLWPCWVQNASTFILHHCHERCQKAALDTHNRKSYRRPYTDRLLSCNDVQPDVTCHRTGENETSTKFTLNGSEKSCGTLDIETSNGTVELLVQNSRCCDLRVADKPIIVLPSEEFGIKVFQTKIKTVIGATALKSSKEQSSLSMEGFEMIELDSPKPKHFIVVSFKRNIKPVLQGQMEYVKHDASFRFMPEQDFLQQKDERNYCICGHHTF